LSTYALEVNWVDSVIATEGLDEYPVFLLNYDWQGNVDESTSPYR
jgi:hypothetical protein